MREWLSKDFNPPADLAGRIAKTAVKRAKKRKAIEKSALFIMPFFVIAVVALLNSPYKFPPLSGEDKGGVSTNLTLSGGDKEVVSAVATSPQPSPDRRGGNFPPISGEDKGGVSTNLTLSGGDKEVVSTVVTSPQPSPDRRGSNFPPLSGEDKGGVSTLSTTPIKFQKVDHSLEISWEGEGEFIIYKCDSPKFDKCSVADVVEGNRYLDKDDNSATIIYYRVEPLKKG
ncbi:MAG: hypothetical protein ACE14Q_06545 [Acidobacteriota bacterium]